ncbi:SDR family oxidoreductase [Babesia caballi]|uniref:SDR family oxidoreductase n=1 Tax=Babesia caballi TaxID=5871 RepID=A0AAV4LUA1_BABCB|nr:SDR family oxidoreductase [Babesia caballi]
MLQVVGVLFNNDADRALPLLPCAAEAPVHVIGAVAAEEGIRICEQLLRVAEQALGVPLRAQDHLGAEGAPPDAHVHESASHDGLARQYPVGRALVQRLRLEREGAELQRRGRHGALVSALAHRYQVDVDVGEHDPQQRLSPVPLVRGHGRLLGDLQLLLPLAVLAALHADEALLHSRRPAGGRVRHLLRPEQYVEGHPALELLDELRVRLPVRPLRRPRQLDVPLDGGNVGHRVDPAAGSLAVRGRELHVPHDAVQYFRGRAREGQVQGLEQRAAVEARRVRAVRLTVPIVGPQRHQNAAAILLRGVWHHQERRDVPNLHHQVERHPRRGRDVVVFVRPLQDSHQRLVFRLHLLQRELTTVVDAPGPAR